jgi:hypothetical protein
MYIAQLVDPTIRSWHLGPGFCTRDNLFGVGYLLVLAVNYTLAVLAFCAVFAILGRIVCWRNTARASNTTEDKFIHREKGGELKSLDRAERGEGSWCGKVRLMHVYIFVRFIGTTREEADGFCSIQRLFGLS